MNIRNRYPAKPLPAEVQADIIRVVSLWAEARSRFGTSGDFLFGEFGAADIMYAPVISRFATYSIELPRFAAAYAQSVIAHPFVQDWIAAAQEEPWVIEKFEQPVS